jgi:hypothetical protein
MERMKRVEDLDIRVFRAQGILGVGATIPTSICSSPAAVCPSITPNGSSLRTLSTLFA